MDFCYNLRLEKKKKISRQHTKSICCRCSLQIFKTQPCQLFDTLFIRYVGLVKLKPAFNVNPRTASSSCSTIQATRVSSSFDVHWIDGKILLKKDTKKPKPLHSSIDLVLPISPCLLLC